MIDRYLTETIGAEHPSWQDVEVADVSEIAGGWETRLYALDVSFRQDGAVGHRPLVARFYQAEAGAAQAAREAAVLTSVAAAGLPVPRLELVSAQPSPYGKAMLLMERVDGSTLGESLAGSDAPMRKMASCLVDLHRLPIDSVFKNDVEPFSDRAFVDASVGGLAAAVDRYRLTEFRPLLGWLAESAPAKGNPSVLHGDYHPGNLIVNEGTNDLTIIDWSFADVGDYRLDVAWSALWTEAVAGAGARSELLAAYEAGAAARIDDLAHFEAIKLGARLMTIALWLDSKVEPPNPRITEAAIRGGYRSTVLTVYERLREVTGIRLGWVEQL